MTDRPEHVIPGVAEGLAESARANARILAAEQAQAANAAAEINTASIFAKRPAPAGPCAAPHESADVTGMTCERPDGHRGDHAADTTITWVDPL